jgi:hypothetical protein
MAVETGEIELHTASLSREKFSEENPNTLLWLLHNFSVISTALTTAATSDDVTAINDAIEAAQAAVAAIQAAIDAIVIPAPFDPSSLQAQIDALEADVAALPPPTPPFSYPSGTNGQVLTHGTLADEVFFAGLPTSVTAIYAPAQTGDLIPVNEGEADEAVLPEFLLTDDGVIMMVPIT